MAPHRTNRSKGKWRVASFAGRAYRGTTQLEFACFAPNTRSGDRPFRCRVSPRMVGDEVLANPRLGQQVLIWYGKGYCRTMPFHGKVGKVVIANKGKPRNHLIRTEGQLVVIPCGNLQKISAVSPKTSSTHLIRQ